MPGVKLFLCLFVFGFAIPGLSAFVEWNSLKATWCPPNMNNPNCFQDIPRTVDSALKRGLRKVHGSTCLNGGKFFGHRMVKENDYALTPLYDEKGIIAGVQVNALKSELFATKNPYKFDEVPDFLDNSIEGQPIYSTTTYFVNPTQICSIGRSRHQFEFEGTASQIYFQTGRNPSHLRSIPIYRDIAAKNYTRANCVNTMGHHNYYNVPKMQLTNCTTITPSFLLFNNNGELHGFGQTTIGKLSSQFFEHPNIAAVRAGLDPITPECMLKIAESAGSPGYSNIHFFLIDSPKAIKCAPIVQTRAIHDSTTINPNAFKKH